MMSSLDLVVNYAHAFVERHHISLLRIAVTTTLTVNPIIAVRYLIKRQLRKFQEANEDMASQRMREFFFDRTQETCYSTILSLLPSFREHLGKLIEPPTLDQLRTSMSQSKTEKLAIWDKRKNLTFGRTMTGLYGFCLLHLFSRIQVQILGRYLFLESIAKKQNELDIVEARALSNNTRMEYLSFSNYFLTDGLPRLSEWVTTSCTQVLAHWPLEKRIRLDDLKQIVEDVRAVVESSSNNNNNNNFFKRFTSLLLPPEDASQLQSPFSSFSAPASLSSSSRSGEEKEGDQAPKLLLLLNETRNYLESEEFEEVLMDSLNTVFGQLIHNLRDAFSTTSTTSSTGTNTTTSPNLAIATIFPLLDKQTKQLLEVDENDYLLVLSATPSISSFARQLFFDNSIAN